MEFGFAQNHHPVQESIQCAVVELPKIFRFAADDGEGTGGCAANARRNAASLSVSISIRLTKGTLLSGRAGGGGSRASPSCANLFSANSHQNSHSPKIKMAADLAASHIVDFKVFLAPQVGLEPTTLRLTAECSAIELLRSVNQRNLHYKGSRQRGLRQKNQADSVGRRNDRLLPASIGLRREFPIFCPRISSRFRNAATWIGH